MSLLLNEDFTLYQLRLGYLNNIHDGVGERLISLNTGVLNEPAFRAAGWVPDQSTIKRCYSPPIPTTGAADYFTRPTRSRQLVESPEDGQGGLLSRRRGSEETLGPSLLSEKEKRRRKQREKMEEDDSSDLSDDSDEEDTAVQSVRFAKMPVRNRAEASPTRNSGLTVEGPEVKVISPSFRPRTSSLGGTETFNVPRRPRGDTITSSEMSSDNEGLDPSTAFRRKIPSRPQKAVMLSDKIAEEQDESELEDEDEEEDVGVVEASDLSDEYDGDEIVGPSPQLMGAAVGNIPSPPKIALDIPPAITPTQSSPRKHGRDLLPKLPRLPSNRPVNVPPPGSLLTMGLKGNGGAAPEGKPFQKYAELSGKGEANPLWIKIYYPFAEKSTKPLEVPIRRLKGPEEGPPTISDLIGLALYRYDDEDHKPALKPSDGRIERWELRMMDDGEVEMDFPALGPTRPVTDFSSNNNRPPQRRMRDKPWDEFGLVRAEDQETDDEDESGPVADQTQSKGAMTPIVEQSVGAPPAPPSLVPNRNPITGPSFMLAKLAVRKDSSSLLDAPQAQTATSTPRTGAQKTVSIHFTDPQSFQTTLLPVPTTADTYIAELFDVACARLRLDKALYVFKVRGTQTVAPSDRTVEALGANLHLDLTRRRFGAVGDFGLGLSGSPGSESPNAPLELVPNTPPTTKDVKRRKGFGVPGVLQAHPAQQRGDMGASSANMLNFAGGSAGRRYHVLRKQPLSFAASHPRTLVITPEFLQILPGTEEGAAGPAPGKVTNIHMSSIVGVKVSRKHPKMVRVLVYREKETKRYDFECSVREEATSIVSDIRVGLSEYGVGDD